MKKIILYILPFLTLFLFISCNKEDVLGAPSTFQVTIEPDFRSANLDWTVSRGENNENLVYSIFLNNEELESNISQTNYVIENLEMATSYTLRVVAQNEGGETAVDASFETLNPDNYTFLLESYQNGESNPVIRYSYYTNGLISAGRDPSEYGECVTYQYDESKY